MSKYTNKIVNGELIALSQDEIDELEARDAAYVPPTEPVLTKEELLAQLNALSAQIQALG